MGSVGFQEDGKLVFDAEPVQELYKRSVGDLIIGVPVDELVDRPENECLRLRARNG
jgi:hypothetical protein